MSQANFYKDGKLLYHSDIQGLVVGAPSGMKPNKFSLTLNQRNNRKGGIIATIFRMFTSKEVNVFYALRQTLRNANTFDEAKLMLSSLPLDSPGYFTLGGVNYNEGVVISRTNRFIQNMTILNNNTDGWFVVQTNYDRNIPDPDFDKRRIPAENRIKNIGQNKMSEQRLFENVLSQEPNMNYKTLETIIMSSQKGLFNLTGWISKNLTSSIKL